MTSFADRFASFEGVVWLDAATRAPMPTASARAVRDSLPLLERPHRLQPGFEVSQAVEARALAARLFTTREEAVSVVRSPAAAAALLVEALDLAAGDEVIVPWGDGAARADLTRIAARRGARIVEVAPADGAAMVTAERLSAAIGPRTRLVYFSHVSPLHGGRLDPALVVPVAREFGACVVVDGSLAAGALPFDLGACSVDLYVAAAERHLLGPPGAALAAWSPRALELVGGGRAEASGAAAAAGAPAGLDAPGLPALLALTESLRLLVEAGTAGVQQHARGLCDRVLRELPPGFHSAGPLEPERRSHVVCVAAWDRRATAEAYGRLVAARIHAALLDDRIRVSPHLYNDESDVGRLLAALANE